MIHLYSNCEWMEQYPLHQITYVLPKIDCISCLLKYLETPNGEFRELFEQKLIKLIKLEEYNHDFEEILK